LCQLGFVPLMSNVKTQTVLEPPLVGAEYARKLPAVIYSHGMLANRSCYSTPCINFFFLAICFFSTPHFAPTFFCPPCAVQACMLSCICTYTCIFFFVYIVYYFFVYSFFLPPMRCASMYAIMYMYTYMYILTYIHTHTFIYRSCYSTPCIDLASHGFIVFAVHTHTHTYTHAHTTRRRWHQSMYVYVCTLYVSSMYVCILCI
jgi:hypothetical protein